MVVERLKYLNNNGITVSPYFWRTYTGAEIDYVEEKNKIQAPLLNFESILKTLIKHLNPYPRGSYSH